MYGVRPARYTIEELVAQSNNAIRNVKNVTQPNPIVWCSTQGRYIHNPEFAQWKNGKFQEV